MKPRLLFSTVALPVPRILQFAATDQMAYRLTRGQELFELYEHTHASGLHLLAQNLEEPVVVLENPPIDEFIRELGKGYEIVGLTFEAMNAERLLEMGQLVRKHAPRARILVGGAGVICAPELQRDPRANGVLEHVCRGEGVAYLRQLLGLKPADPIRCLLPKEGSTLPWLSPRPLGTFGVILAGLGCTGRCPFCATSAYTGGGYIEVMSAAQIFRAMLDYWQQTPLTNSVWIYDENFLDHHDKVSALGELIQADRRFGLRQLNYCAFGSLRALDRYDSEQLLLAGIDTVWVGIESKFSPLAKRRGVDDVALLDRLHSIGIKTVASWIIGQDFQTPDNIQEDIDHFVDLDPTMQQLSVLTVAPGTPLYAAYERQGRLPATVPWNAYHLYGETFIPEQLSHARMRALLDVTYRRIYSEKGAAITKILEVNVNGYERCRASRHPLLRVDRAAYFRQRSQSYFPLLKAARTLAPSRAVQHRLDELDQRYRDIFGRPSRGEEEVSDQILKNAYAEAERRAREGEPSRYRPEPFRRYLYPPPGERTTGKPYRVEYPASHARQELQTRRRSRRHSARRRKAAGRRRETDEFATS